MKNEVLPVDVYVNEKGNIEIHQRRAGDLPNTVQLSPLQVDLFIQQITAAKKEVEVF